MTLAPFAAIEAAMNRDCLRHLANATALFDGAAGPVAAIFEADYATATGGAAGFAGSQPAITCADDSVPSSAMGTGVEVRGQRYIVAELRPDGVGMTTVLLELA